MHLKVCTVYILEVYEVSGVRGGHLALGKYAERELPLVNNYGVTRRG